MTGLKTDRQTDRKHAQLSHLYVLIWSPLLYRTIQNFGGRKFWRIWRITSDSPKFSPLISYKHVQIDVDIDGIVEVFQLKCTRKHPLPDPNGE